MPRTTNPDFLNGVPELMILRTLLLRPMYGYELVESLRHEATNVFDFGEGSIYPVLHRLEKQGMLTSRRDLVGGRVRRIYEPTEQGKGRFAETSSAWLRLSQALNSLLQGDGHASPIAG